MDLRSTRVGLTIFDYYLVRFFFESNEDPRVVMTFRHLTGLDVETSDKRAILKIILKHELETRTA